MARQKKQRPTMAAELRPMAKALIKEAIRVYDATKEALSEAGERFEDLVNEARSEMKKGALSKPPPKRRRQ
jgi:Protein of unknown function (DUF5132)